MYMYVFFIDKNVRYDSREINKKKKQTIWHPMKTRNQFSIDRDTISFSPIEWNIISSILQIVNKIVNENVENSSIYKCLL